MFKNIKIFTPLSYLKLRNEGIFYHTWVVPVLLTILVIFITQFFPEKIDLFGINGLIRSLNQILSILVAFYIASLAAIATFSTKSLDEEISGRPINLKSKRSGQIIDESLTRRRFLCLLFAYCAFLSMVIFCVGELAVILKSNLIAIVNEIITLQRFRFIFQVFYTFAILNLLSTTLLGLHYLADRIHRA